MRDDRGATRLQAVEAEQAVIGGILIDPLAFFRVSDLLTEADFSVTGHALVFAAVRNLLREGRPVDTITVNQRLIDDGHDARTGGMTYLIEIAANTPSAANIVGWAELVAKAAERRRLSVAGAAIAAAETYAEAAQILARVPVNTKSSVVTAKEGAKSMYQALLQRYDSDNGLTGLPTHIESLDGLLGGLEGGKTYWFAARPGMGKTTMGVQLAVSMGRVLFFSFEMTAASLIERATANLGRFPHRWLRFPKETEAEPLWESGVLVKAVQAVNELRMVIDDSPRLTPDQLIARAKQAHMTEPLDAIIIDHFGWLALPGKNNVTELGDASKAMKALAKDLNVPVIILYQLNRGVTERAGNEPALQDLRGSGQIEEDADVVVFLHRPEYYNQEPKGYVKFIGAKVRDGAAGVAWATARLSHMRFESCAEPETMQAPKQRPGGLRFNRME